ncbi:hypothetical protein GGI11_002691 [Coemansia sp. RSA 2049]|nr:hypothetical protein GGI11_002691 [Coemansia sp. RSA 2049]
MSPLSSSVASRIPEDCLLLILDYLWDDRPAAQFIERRSEYSQDYDQIRIRHSLCARAISPIHVCKSWRQHAIHRYFRYVSVGLVNRQHGTNKNRVPAELPSTARPFVDTLLIQVDTVEDNCQLGAAAAGLSRLVPRELPRVRRIGLCVRDSMPRHSHHMAGWFGSYLRRGMVLENHLALEILNKLPALESVWFQSTTMAGLVALSLVRTLTNYAELVDQQMHSPWASGMPVSLVQPKNSGKVHVAAIHLLSTTMNDGDTAIDIIRDCAHDLHYLCLGMVSGGVLGSLVQWHPARKRLSISMSPASAAVVGNDPQVRVIGTENGTHEAIGSLRQAVATYPQLRRLIFGVDTHVHVNPTAMAPQGNEQHREEATSPTTNPMCPFPALEELYFDHTLSNGLPMEEWYAPLYDVFLKHPNMKLKHLTFPIIYNTQRMVSSRNCPELVSLRHIKCCWSTGVWSTTQAESDSTRVLKAVATIPTLTRYIHPSYIEGLSALPTVINCTGLKYLDLYGWPLSLDNILWLLSTFDNLQLLRVTVVPTVSTPATTDDRNQDQDQLVAAVQRLSSSNDTTTSYGHSELPAMLDQLPGDIGISLQHLVIGAGGEDLGYPELSRLFVILNSLPMISFISLYSNAYSFVKTNLESCCGVCFPDTGLLQTSRARISNLDNAGLHYFQPSLARDDAHANNNNGGRRGRQEPMVAHAVDRVPSMESMAVPWRGRRLLGSNDPATVAAIARATEAAAGSRHVIANVGGNAGNNANGSRNGWHLIHRLLLGE